MSGSWTETFGTLMAWRRQRLAHGLFIPAAFTLALASTAGQPLTWWTPLAIPVAWLALAAMRLWDDLEDRERDRTSHAKGSGRVWLGDSRRIGVVISICLVPLSAWMPGLLALMVALFIFYRLRPSSLEAILLLKYPVLVLLLRGSLDTLGIATMALVYGGMLIDSKIRLAGSALIWLATAAFVALCPMPGALLLAVGLLVPWIKPVRPLAMVAIMFQLVALHLILGASVEPTLF